MSQAVLGLAIHLHGSGRNYNGEPSEGAGRKAIMKANQEAADVAGMARSRYTELKRMLQERRGELQAQVQGKMRDVRAEGTWGGKMNEVLDAVESSEADIQEDIEFALIQMKSETLNKVNDALGRLERGDYGNCFECGEEIAEKRLRALPFAVRCKDCEEAKEVAERRERQAAQRRGASSLFLDI
jgi:DnaK suppressor protein